jgi:hypothetical protein
LGKEKDDRGRTEDKDRREDMVVIIVVDVISEDKRGYMGVEGNRA